MPEKTGNWLLKPLTCRLTIAITLLVSLCIHACVLLSFTYPSAGDQVVTASAPVVNIALMLRENSNPPVPNLSKQPVTTKLSPLPAAIPEPAPALTPEKTARPHITKTKTVAKKAHQQKNRQSRQPRKLPITTVSGEDKAGAQHKQRAASSTAGDPETPILAAKPVSQQVRAEEIRLTYLQQLRQRIMENKRYPLLARKRRLEGKVLIHFEVDGRGKILALNLISGPRLLQGSAENAVKNALPFPPPTGISLPVKIDLTLSYHFRRQT